LSPSSEAAVAAPPKLGARLAAKLQAEILAGGFPVGQHLGAERELMARHGVSRSTLREAVRQLEAFGVVQMRRGGGGGLIVAEQPSRLAARAVTTYLALVDVDWDELFEVRIILESFAAGLAAQRASEPDAMRLRELARRLFGDRPPEVVAAHGAIRELIPAVGGNAAIVLFVAAFNRLTFDAVGGQVGGASFAAAAREAAEAKLRIVEAIVARDAPRAQSEARRELIERRETLRPLREACRGGDPPFSDDELTIRLEAGFATKRSHKLAEAMARELALFPRAAGSRLGSEAELAARFKASRAVFREAIHILETHGLVRARRGQHGGIIVGVPRPEHTVQIASGYLARLDLPPSVLEETRSGIAIVAARLAARRGSPDEHSRLRELLDRQLASSGVAHTAAAAEVQRYIGDMSGNRAISLILRVLIEAGWRGPPRALKEPALSELRRSHRELVSAITSRDEALAERRMVQHVHRTRRWLEKLSNILEP
jgi:DNA-binding FadR family transcriptional regulator